ncbi:hypothetical protein Tco_1014702 [Tanacetum coccineum]
MASESSLQQTKTQVTSASNLNFECDKAGVGGLTLGGGVTYAGLGGVTPGGGAYIGFGGLTLGGGVT